VFVLGALIGGVLVAHTPLGGSPSAAASPSATSSGYDGNQNDPGTDAANDENNDLGIYEDEDRDETPDVLQNTFGEVLPNEEKTVEGNESASNIDDGETTRPPSDTEETFDNEDDKEETIDPIDENKGSAKSNVDANTMTSESQSTSTPYTGDDNDDRDDLVYVPGDLSQLKKGLLLSRGLDVAIIAQSNRPVVMANGTHSKLRFHANPDFGATFAYPDDDKSNPGGYVYVSNAEVKRGGGGVGAIYFNKDGGIIDYKMLLRGTSMNCGGGRTFWNTWISCEEKRGDRSGQIYQVDPFNRRPPEETVMGGGGGAFESFAYRVGQGSSKPTFFVTEDHAKGSLRRFTPDLASIKMRDPWTMLHGGGTLEFLLLWPNKGTYEWTHNKARADRNAKNNYKSCEGIDVKGNRLYFVSKAQQELFVLDLDSNTYEVESTISGVFDGSPDQLVRLVGDRELLYYTEEGGKSAGIHARDSQGRFFTILESPVYEEETTGLAFSPDHRHLYVACEFRYLLLSSRDCFCLPISYLASIILSLFVLSVPLQTKRMAFSSVSGERMEVPSAAKRSM